MPKRKLHFDRMEDLVMLDAATPVGLIVNTLPVAPIVAVSQPPVFVPQTLDEEQMLQFIEVGDDANPYPANAPPPLDMGPVPDIIIDPGAGPAPPQ